jgi:translocation and assembly module TamA
LARNGARGGGGLGQGITARHGDASLDARIAITPGPVVSFGQLIPQGQSRMRPERIVEIAGLPQGVTFRPRCSTA